MKLKPKVKAKLGTLYGQSNHIELNMVNILELFTTEILTKYNNCCLDIESCSTLALSLCLRLRYLLF